MMVNRCVLPSNTVIVKSPTDRRIYRFVKLPNGLCTLLVHDPEIYSGEKKAAAAMCVLAGSFDDPPEAQGLAHFLEHMLFMGSTAFPDENEYRSYLCEHGGSSNAYTEMEHTCYHFEVQKEFLKGALTRFAQFFTSPLVKAEAMEREALAVDSEFNQVLQSDMHRLQQLQRHTSAPGHPFNRFIWGNKKSFANAEKGINLRDQILKLYHEKYNAGSMKLVVIGGETLQVLESWVLELFSSVKKGLLAKPEMSLNVPIWKTGKLYWLEAVIDFHILELSWILPSLRKDYLKKADDYLAYLLGYEGRGSLHFLLKAKGWATSVSAGVSDGGIHRSTIAYIFHMSIYLTDSGLEKIIEILGFVYQYLKLLHQGPPQGWIFKELPDIGNMNFRIPKDQPQHDYAVKLAGNLLVYPPEHVIYGEYAYEIWDKEMIKHLLSFFRPRNMRVDVLTKSFKKSQYIKHEPWFGSQYVEEDIPFHLMDIWENPSKIDSSLHLPSKNYLIPRDFCQHSDRVSYQIEDASYPRFILDTPYMSLWYKLHKNFKLPHSNTFFRITLNRAYDNIRNAFLTKLFLFLLEDKLNELNEITYQASIANLVTSGTLYGDILELRIYGFNDNLSLVLAKILEITKTFVPKDDRFRVVKEEMERTLRNTNMNPLNHSAYLRLHVLCQSLWDVEEELSVLNGLSLADLSAFTPDLFAQMHIEGICHGNLLEYEALQISDITKSSLPDQPLPLAWGHKEFVACLPTSADIASDARVKNKQETNSVVEIVPEEETNYTKLSVLANLFGEIVEEPFINQLRTKEQLGYSVYCSPMVTYDVLGFHFGVQSSEYNPVYIQGRIDNFINGLEEKLDGLDRDSFENYRDGLKGKLLERDPTLSHETNRLWDQMEEGRYTFDYPQTEVEELKGIKKGDVIDWYRRYLRQPSPNCRRVTTRVWGCNTEWKDDMK